MKEIERVPLGARGETEKVRCDGKKSGIEARGRGTRGNKPDGEFEGDEVNGDRRRMNGERAGEGKRGWLTKETGGRRPSGLKSSIARILAMTSRKSCDCPLVYCTFTPPAPFCLRATVRLGLYPSSFIIYLRGRRKTDDIYMAFSFLSSTHHILSAVVRYSL